MNARPVLLVTTIVPPDRVASLRALHEREGLEVAIYDGRRHHDRQGALRSGNGRDDRHQRGHASAREAVQWSVRHKNEYPAPA